MAQIARRDFLRRAGLIAAGLIGADQVDILERLTWTRTLFPSAAVSPGLIAVTNADLSALIRRVYSDFRFAMYRDATLS